MSEERKNETTDERIVSNDQPEEVRESDNKEQDHNPIVSNDQDEEVRQDPDPIVSNDQPEEVRQADPIAGPSVMNITAPLNVKTMIPEKSSEPKNAKKKKSAIEPYKRLFDHDAVKQLGIKKERPVSNRELIGWSGFKWFLHKNKSRVIGLLVIITIFLVANNIYATYKQGDSPENKKKIIAYVLAEIVLIGFFKYCILDHIRLPLQKKNNAIPFTGRYVIKTLLSREEYHKLDPECVKQLKDKDKTIEELKKANESNKHYDLSKKQYTPSSNISNTLSVFASRFLPTSTTEFKQNPTDNQNGSFESI